MVDDEQLFISYGHSDTVIAHRLAEDLKDRGARVWIAPESIRPGETWVDAINRGLEESKCVLVVLTPAGLESSWVQKEVSVSINLEREGRLSLIPLEMEPSKVPPLLSSYQMVSFRESYDLGLRQLADSLQRQGLLPKLSSIASKLKTGYSSEALADALLKGIRESSSGRGNDFEQVVARLRELLSIYTLVEASKISSESEFENDLSIPSVRFSAFFVPEVEKEFELEVPASKLSDFETVGDLAVFLSERLKEKGSS